MDTEKSPSFASAEIRDDLSPQKLIRLESDYEGPDNHLEQREQEETIYAFELPEKFQKKYAELLQDLPEGVAVIGGAARSAARYLIAGDDEPVRDIDLVALVDEDGFMQIDEDTSWELTHKYMPDDAEYGHAMGRDTLESLFLERDLTVNQCAIIDGQLLISEAAIQDFQADVIRPSTFELDWSYDGDEAIKSRLALRMLTMKTTMELKTGREFNLAGYNPREIRPFDIAVSLNKMMSRGRANAEAFCTQLSTMQTIPGDFSGDPIGLASWLLRTGAVMSFEFRNNTAAEFAKEDDSYILAIRALRRYSGGSREVRDAAAEYDDYPETKYYTPAEYDKINSNAQYVRYEDYEYDYDEDDDDDEVDYGDEDDYEDDYEDYDDYEDE